MQAITYSPKCIYEDFFNRSVVFQKMKLWKVIIYNTLIINYNPKYISIKMIFPANKIIFYIFLLILNIM